MVGEAAQRQRFNRGPGFFAEPITEAFRWDKIAGEDLLRELTWEPTLHLGKVERVMGFEPTTFAMATRRSSQLSYTRTRQILKSLT